MEFLEEQYRVAQKLVNTKYCLVLTGMFIYKLTGQFVELYQRCELNMGVLISNIFFLCKFNEQ
jgi:hypothetical protein